MIKCVESNWKKSNIIKWNGLYIYSISSAPKSYVAWHRGDERFMEKTAKKTENHKCD